MKLRIGNTESLIDIDTSDRAHERLARPVYAAGSSALIGIAHRLDRGLWCASAHDWPHEWPQLIGNTESQVSEALRLAVYARSALSGAA